MQTPRTGGRAGILFGFVPLIVYGILAGPSAQSRIVALGTATLVSIVVGYEDLKKGRILTWANLVLFGGLLAATAGLGMTGLLPWSGVLIYAVLAAVAFGSILAGYPFTLQYARGMVEPAHQDSTVFLRVNRFMTGVWGCIFAANVLLDYLALAPAGPSAQAASLLTYGVLAAGIIFTLWYPGQIRKTYARSPPGAK